MLARENKPQYFIEIAFKARFRNTSNRIITLKNKESLPKPGLNKSHTSELNICQSDELSFRFYFQEVFRI